MNDPSPNHRPPAEPIFEELGIVRDARNLFHQVVEQVLVAADLAALPRSTRCGACSPDSDDRGGAAPPHAGCSLPPICEHPP